MERTIVLGSNFAGMSAALELKRKTGKSHEVVVISPSSKFLYVPSLIWVPFGRRKVSQITFDIKDLLHKKGISFIHDFATEVKPTTNEVITTSNGTLTYDYLVIATGVNMDFNALENLHPEAGFVQNIAIPKYAEKAHIAFEALVKSPGNVVVGATQGASCMGAAYEYLFNIDKELRRRKVRDKVNLTWITPEPFLGHFGIGGMNGGEKMLKTFMKMYNINWMTNAAIQKIQHDQIVMQDGTVLPYKMAMLMPPFLGIDAIKTSKGLADEKGFIPTSDAYQHRDFPNIFAAGLAVQVPSPFKNCAVPFGVPKTGFPSDVTGKLAAENIYRLLNGKTKLREEAWGKIPGVCILDAGYKEVWIFSDHLFKPRRFELMLPNIFNDFMKVFIEKYLILKNKRGWAFLP